MSNQTKASFSPSRILDCAAERVVPGSRKASHRRRWPGRQQWQSVASTWPHPHSEPNPSAAQGWTAARAQRSRAKEHGFDARLERQISTNDGATGSGKQVFHRRVRKSVLGGCDMDDNENKPTIERGSFR